MSAFATSMFRWQPIVISGALQMVSERWHGWALRQRAIIISGKPGIAVEEYEAV